MKWRSRSGPVAFGRWPEKTGGRRREQADRDVQDQAEEAKPEKKPDAPSPPEKPGTRPVSRAARMLALAHYVDRLVEEGSVKSYADAARQLGVTRARMSQIVNLLNLSPRVQEGLLLGVLHLSERRIRALVAGVEWEDAATRE